MLNLSFKVLKLPEKLASLELTWLAVSNAWPLISIPVLDNSLITGTISLISVIISSIVAKFIDYKKNRKEYLSQKIRLAKKKYSLL